MERNQVLRNGATVMLAFIAVTIGLGGAYLAQFLPWETIGVTITLLART